MSKNHHAPRTRQIIQSFEAKALKKRSSSSKVVDSFTSFFGSLGFLLLNIAIFVFWILINSGKIPGISIFDPYPHVLLITAVSLEAILLTTIVLMSQNRQSQIGTLRDELQLQVELITEKEITKLLRMTNRLLKKNGIEVTDEELGEMLKEVDTSYIERKLEQQLTPKTKSVPQKVVEKVIQPVSK